MSARKGPIVKKRLSFLLTDLVGSAANCEDEVSSVVERGSDSSLLSSTKFFSSRRSSSCMSATSANSSWRRFSIGSLVESLSEEVAEVPAPVSVMPPPAQTRPSPKCRRATIAAPIPPQNSSSEEEDIFSSSDITSEQKSVPRAVIKKSRRRSTMDLPSQINAATTESYKNDIDLCHLFGSSIVKTESERSIEGPLDREMKKVYCPHSNNNDESGDSGNSSFFESSKFHLVDGLIVPLSAPASSPPPKLARQVSRRNSFVGNAA